MDAQNGGDFGHGAAGVELPLGVIAKVVRACSTHLRLPPLHVIREPLSSRSDKGYDFAVQLINHCVPNLSTSEPK
jgi:hypothetical protein